MKHAQGATPDQATTKKLRGEKQGPLLPTEPIQKANNNRFIFHPIEKKGADNEEKTRAEDEDKEEAGS